MLDRLRQFVELKVLGVALLVGACLWAFFGLVDEVLEGETHAFDSALLLALRNPDDLSDPIGGVAVEEMARDITAFGGFTVVTAVTIAVCGLLWLMGKGRTMFFVAAAVIGGTLLSTGFKQLFDRPRPDLVPHEMLVHSASFPSGHTMLAAVTYLTLATIFASVETRRAVKIYVIALAVLVTIAVGSQPGLSRRPLAHRRCRRMDPRRRLGAGLLGGRALAAVSRRSGARPARRG